MPAIFADDWVWSVDRDEDNRLADGYQRQVSFELALNGSESVLNRKRVANGPS